jgi:hypothetical protein
MTSLPPETAAHHIRNVLQALVPDNIRAITLEPAELYAIRKRLIAALIEIEREYAVDLAPGARMDGAPLGHEPEDS